MDLDYIPAPSHLEPDCLSATHTDRYIFANDITALVHGAECIITSSAIPLYDVLQLTRS